MHGWTTWIAAVSVAGMVGCAAPDTYSRDPAGAGESPATADPGGSADVAPYPLDFCLVSGQALDSMGGPHVFVHEGQEIKMCCKGCVREFQADPAPFLAKLK